jgi:hypothetical protein
MTQQNVILAYLQKGNTLTPIDALTMFGCFRLAARIQDLRDSGHDIKTRIVKAEGKRYAEYFL